MSSIGLYVHFPWCVKKCPYCDFNSHSINGKIPEHEYVSCLVNDLCEEASNFDGNVNSIFLVVEPRVYFRHRALENSVQCKGFVNT